MRSMGIILPSPAFNDDLGFLQRVKDFSIQQFISQFTVERFHIAIFARTARLNEERRDFYRLIPLAQALGDKFRPIIGTNRLRAAMPKKQGP